MITMVRARLTFSYVSCGKSLQLCLKLYPILTYHTAGDSTDVIQPTDLSVNPNNVDPGAVITVSAKGMVTDVIDVRILPYFAHLQIFTFRTSPWSERYCQSCC